MEKIFSLQNKIAIVSGGYGHLGRSCVRALQQAGAVVIVAGRRISEFQQVFAGSPKVFFEHLDLAQDQSITQAIAHIHQNYGGLDILVNNAFYGARCLPATQDFAAWQRGIDGVLTSVYKMIETAIPYLKESQSPRIINIASMYGIQVPDFTIYEEYPHLFNPPNYGTAKAGVIHLTKYYAKFLAPYNILVNAISPGPFPAAEVQQAKGFIQALEQHVPLRRIGHPDELKGVIIFLASQACSYVTGQNIVVDGGWTL